MKHEPRSPEEVGADYSGDQPLEDISDGDGEPENELEALQNLPADERRKALRRLRNRESARRVRARRLAEMSSMEVTVHGMQDENTQLKAMTRKLQNHVQAMTLKVYEITAKYESAVAENAQLRAELQVVRRPSLRPSLECDSSFVQSAAPAPPCPSGQGPNSAPLYASPFVAPCGAGDGTDRSPSAAPTLSMGHANLRESSAMDLKEQRAALEEVVFLLKEHKRRGNPAANAAIVEHSTCSEIASTATGCMNNNNAAAKVPSPVPDSALPPCPMFGGAGDAYCTSAVLGQRQGSGAPSLEGGAAASSMRAYQSDGMLHAVDVRGGAAHSQLGLNSSLNASQMPPLSQLQQIQQQHQMQAQQQQLQMQLQMQQQHQMAACSSGPLPTFNLQAQQMQQQQVAGMQGCSDTLLQMRQQQMLMQGGQQSQPAPMFGGASLAAPFYGATSFLTSQGSSGPHSHANNNFGSGNNALGMMQGGGQLNRGGLFADAGLGFGGVPQGGGLQPQWPHLGGHSGGPVVSLQCPDVPLDDVFMSLVDEFLPQDM